MDRTAAWQAVAVLATAVLLVQCSPAPPHLPPATMSSALVQAPASVNRVTAADLGATWRPGCPVGPEQLRRVELDYLGFDGQPHRGALVVHEDLVPQVIAIFEQLYRMGYPIERMIAVPLFAPELQGHAERLETALLDAQPAVILTTTAANPAVGEFLMTLPPRRQPRVMCIDEIPDAAGEMFEPIVIDVDDVSHLQYTSGSTRPPVGVEITHRAVGTNLLQMILSIDLLDRNTHGVSWLPLYHDMGLSMIGFPAVYGGHSTLMYCRWIAGISTPMFSDGLRGRCHSRVTRSVVYIAPLGAPVLPDV